MNIKTLLDHKIILHLKKYRTYYLVILTIFVTVLFCKYIPLYFRGDDAHYMKWASENSNPFNAFVQTSLFETYRPLNMIAWWILYRTFGLYAPGYQAVMFILYILCLISLFKVAEAVFSRRVAYFATVTYLVLFYYLATVVFWFSDLAFLLEVMLINISLYLLINAVRYSINPAWGIIVFLMAILAKEPATLIIPICFIAYIYVEWNNIGNTWSRKKLIITASILLGLGITSATLHPKLGTYVLKSVTSTKQGFDLARIFGTSRFYTNILLPKSGLLIWFAVFFSTSRALLIRTVSSDRNRFIASIVISLFLTIAVIKFRFLAIPIFFLSAMVMVLTRQKELVPAVWAALPLASLLAMDVQLRTYLFEASMGFAILTGSALEQVIVRLNGELMDIRSKSLKRVLGSTIIVVFIIAGLAGGIKILRPKVDSMEMVSAMRLNFRDVVKYIVTTEDSSESTLIMVSYKDMGIDYNRDIITLGDKKKARLQKVMDCSELEKLLQLSGKDNIKVIDLFRARENGCRGKIYLIVMNEAERRFLKNMAIKTDLVFTVERKGEVAQLLSVSDLSED